MSPSSQTAAGGQRGGKLIIWEQSRRHFVRMMAAATAAALDLPIDPSTLADNPDCRDADQPQRDAIAHAHLVLLAINFAVSTSRRRPRGRGWELVDADTLRHLGQVAPYGAGARRGRGVHRRQGGRGALQVRTVISTRSRVILHDAFIKRQISPSQTVSFDEIIPDAQRLSDVRAALVDQRFDVECDEPVGRGGMLSEASSMPSDLKITSTSVVVPAKVTPPVTKAAATFDPLTAASIPPTCPMMIPSRMVMRTRRALTSDAVVVLPFIGRAPSPSRPIPKRSCT